MITTINGYVMTELYQGERKLKSKVTSGFASVQQKSALIKLKVLGEAVIVQGTKAITIPEGCYILVKEEILYTHKHLTQQYEIDGSPNKFMLVDSTAIIGMEI